MRKDAMRKVRPICWIFVIRQLKLTTDAVRRAKPQFGMNLVCYQTLLIRSGETRVDRIETRWLDPSLALSDIMWASRFKQQHKLSGENKTEVQIAKTNAHNNETFSSLQAADYTYRSKTAEDIVKEEIDRLLWVSDILKRRRQHRLEAVNLGAETAVAAWTPSMVVNG